MEDTLRPRAAGRISVGDAALYCRDYGPADAPVTLLLLHGNGESWRCFAAVLPALVGAGYRVLAADSRGHGASGRGRLPLTPVQLARDALDLLDALGIPQAVPVGFSDGGNTVLTMALMSPERLPALVAAGPNLVPAGVRLSVQLPCELAYAACRGAGALLPAARARADLLGLMVDQPRLRFDELAGVRLPALILGGGHDMIRRGHLAHIAAALPQGRLRLLADADHFVFAPRFAPRSAALVLEFLAANGLGTERTAQKTPCGFAQKCAPAKLTSTQ